MEILIELLLFFAQVFLEAVIEFIVLVTANITLGPERTEEKPILILFRTIAFVLLGAACGAASLWIWPTLMLGAAFLRVFSLIVTPLLVGLAIVGWREARRRRGHPELRLDHFAYAYVFALTIGLVRFAFGRVP